MNIIVYDGFCNLCDFSVRQILKHDKHRKCKFAQLHSNFAQNLLTELRYDNDANKTVLLIQNNKIFEKSDAFIEICKLLTGYPRFFVVIRFVPRPVRDFFYMLISKNRYLIFGRKKMCTLPDGDFNDQFISS